MKTIIYMIITFLILLMVMGHLNKKIDTVYKQDYQRALNQIKGSGYKNSEILIWALQPYVRDNYQDARFHAAYIHASGATGEIDRNTARLISKCSNAMKKCTSGEVEYAIAKSMMLESDAVVLNVEIDYWLNTSCNEGYEKACEMM